MRIRMLGGFTVSVGPRTIRQDEWRSKKAATLVKLLALASGYSIHRERAMDLLWPDSGKKAASNSLRQVVYVARRVLHSGPGSRESYLGLQDQVLVLYPDRQLWVDVDAFEEAAALARRSRDPAAYRVAIDLYAGELLPEDRYEEWAEGRRAQLRQLYLALVMELAALYEEREEHAMAINALNEAINEEPTLEEAHASLMRLHALSGRPERALTQYERLHDALQSGLGTQPAEATRRLREEIAAGRLPTAPPADPVRGQPSDGAKHNLPAPMNSFVGREREMVEVKRTLAMTRLLTLTGAGGTGKTRLALEVACDLVGSYPHGVWLVELASLSEPGLVVQEVANVLGVQERPGEPITDTLVEALAAQDMLLVLDNCEHLVEEAAWLVDKLLASCPRLKVLATSREPLAVPGEVNWAVPPLSLPGTNTVTTLEALVRNEAVRLFVDRARLRLLDFEVTQENAGAVARVCSKLEGIPLAIELATARMGLLAVEQVAQRLDASLDVLKGTNRIAQPRQRTLRATLDWSYDLLSKDEQALFERLSVFTAGWTLEAAEAVCSGGGIEEEYVLDLLGGLVDKSLVVVGTHEGAAVRYRLLEPIRQYAAQKLGGSGEAEEVRARHAACFLALAEEAELELAGQRQGLWVERLEAEHDNLRAALSWLLERGEHRLALRLVAALWRFWHLRGHSSEGVRWLERALAQGNPAASPARVKALEGMGWLTQLRGDFDRAQASYEEMLELSRMLGDQGNVATALNGLGTVATYAGDGERARELLRENLRVLDELEAGNSATLRRRFHALNLLGALAIYEEGDYAHGEAMWQESLALIREAGDTDQVGLSLSNLAYPILLQGEYERARQLCEEALSVARKLGSLVFVPTAHINLGLVFLGLGEHQRAAESFREALVLSRDVGANLQTIEALEGMTSMAGATGEAAHAARLWAATQAAREAGGIPLPPGERALHGPHLAAARTHLTDEAWEAALAEGRAMSFEDAAEYALSEWTERATATDVQDSSTYAEAMGDLTPREREVANLVARGLTNRQIATELTISERTAANHVAKILKKLGLESRTQIASWAAQHLPLAPDQ